MKTRILFLFNHDAAHQAAHIAGIAGQLVLQAPHIQVVIATGVEAIRNAVAAMVPPEAHQAIEWRSLEIPNNVKRRLTSINKVAPVLRLARLRYNLDLFAGVDVVVSTERTCLRVRRQLRDAAPRFVYVPHGSGDRNVAYHPHLAEFDLMLLSGQKLVDEMVRHRIVPAAKCRIIGYPKFDTVPNAGWRRFFDNDRPVFLYNPHFDPFLSSWYKVGIEILEYFSQNPQYNLIFAPHVMLFRKKFHFSLEYKIGKIRPDIPNKYLAASNIIVDVDGQNLFDMSYTRSAHVYIGDVSSQVYEFLHRRGACFFLDAARQTKVGARLPYEFWENGDVCQTIRSLTSLLPEWRERAESYRPTQDRLFGYTMDHNPQLSSVERASMALASYAEMPCKVRRPEPTYDVRSQQFSMT
ncbi:hypothetical protein [Sphingomonas crocodyli]|uniref:Glycosyl transferase n=1 Tax=Sphingomonas crocodyli TaxID=1979270 RepID=A0A437M5S6_9SPHN|nr:hypothetical protein [Sphingomonas crocodyli]RVT93090.1 hypothetical protein EOD43_04110 [Sphingomonas crocodyli]